MVQKIIRPRHGCNKISDSICSSRTLSLLPQEVEPVSPPLELRWDLVTTSTNRHYVTSEASSQKAIPLHLVLSPGMLTLGTEPPCCEEAWATWRGPCGENEDPRPQPSSSSQLVSHFGSRSKSPQLSSPSWWCVKQRWAFPTVSCPNYRFVRKKKRLFLFHAAKLWG